MFRLLRRLFGYQRIELTMFQAAIAANIRATSNYQTLRGPAELDSVPLDRPLNPIAARRLFDQIVADLDARESGS